MRATKIGGGKYLYLFLLIIAHSLRNIVYDMMLLIWILYVFLVELPLNAKYVKFKNHKLK